MSMLLPEVAEESGAASASGKGLSLGQSASAGNKLLPKAKTNHPYVVGLSLVVIGGFALIGSLTGTLPSMIAALFVPQALEDGSHNSVAPNLSSIANNLNTGLKASSGILGNFLP